MAPATADFNKIVVDANKMIVNKILNVARNSLIFETIIDVGSVSRYSFGFVITAVP